MDESIEVIVVVPHPPAATKYFVFEAEYPEEGFVGEFDHYPSADELKGLCESYVEKKPCR